MHGHNVRVFLHRRSVVHGVRLLRQAAALHRLATLHPRLLLLAAARRPHTGDGAVSHALHPKRGWAAGTGVQGVALVTSVHDPTIIEVPLGEVGCHVRVLDAFGCPTIYGLADARGCQGARLGALPGEARDAPRCAVERVAHITLDHPWWRVKVHAFELLRGRRVGEVALHTARDRSTCFVVALHGDPVPYIARARVGVDVISAIAAVTTTSTLRTIVDVRTHLLFGAELANEGRDLIAAEAITLIVVDEVRRGRKTVGALAKLSATTVDAIIDVHAPGANVEVARCGAKYVEGGKGGMEGGVRASRRVPGVTLVGQLTGREVDGIGHRTLERGLRDRRRRPAHNWHARLQRRNEFTLRAACEDLVLSAAALPI
mmetsp:Transcript_93047/g.233872  ORF Transcript_93047/g.233872 Transcript_93047/m.233872 type:complete len:374 (+) Transcript_93047:4383-5504(+)